MIIEDVNMGACKTKSRILWLDLLKVISIISMIALHVSAYQLSIQSIGSLNWQISNFINSCSRFCVPVFVMISGSIFLNRNCYMDKYVKRIGIALIFWTFTYALYANGIDLLQGNLIFLKYINSLFYPTYLWFLFMILGLYLSTPILRMIIKENSVTQRFLILWLIFGVCLPMMSNVPILNRYVNSVLYQTHFTMALEYSGYFVLGFYLTRHCNLIPTKLAWLLLAIGITTTFIGTRLVAENIGQLSEMFYNYLSPMTLLSSIGVFVLCKNLFNCHNFNQRTSAIISRLASLSLGIYAIHMFTLVAFNKIGLPLIINNAAISTILICIISFGISSMLAIAMSKIPLLRDLV